MTTQAKPRLLNFRVLVSFHPMWNVFVASCLETGNVVTADDQPTVIEMAQEILEDEVSFALAHDNLKNLLGSPLKIEAFLRWSSAKAEVATQYEGSQRLIGGHDFSFGVTFAFENCQSQQLVAGDLGAAALTESETQ